MFCSSRCRDFWERMEMARLSKVEQDGVKRALADVGKYVAGVGMDKPLSAYTKDEALGLIAAAYVSVREWKELDDDVPF